LGVEIPKGLRSFRRLSKKTLIEINKLGRERAERIQKGAQKLISYARHVLKRIPGVVQSSERKLTQLSQEGKHQVARSLARCSRELLQQKELVEKVIYQTQERFRGHHIADKIYSLHEPQVACIRKGKRGKPAEYGSKVCLSTDSHGYVVAHQEYPSNPADAQLLEEACQSWEKSFGRAAQILGADRGFHQGPASPGSHLAKVKRLSIPTKGKRAHPHCKTYWFRAAQRKRAAIEAVISHLKTDHRMNRCRYKGFQGDRINVILATVAWNLKKWGTHLVAQYGQS
jgi:IS5 family transposase